MRSTMALRLAATWPLIATPCSLFEEASSIFAAVSLAA